MAKSKGKSRSTQVRSKLAIQVGERIRKTRKQEGLKKMARQLGVQRQLLANRMKYLHILTSDVPYRHTLSLMEAG